MTQEQHPSISDADFGAELTELVSHLRAFGRSLCGNPDHADDLVQETMMKAWASRASFKPGTSMRAWTFTILRNSFLTEMRRAKFKGEYDEIAAERQLKQPGEQEAIVDLKDVQRAMMQLPEDQREALVLVGAAGFAYAEAAEVAGCAVGTMKSRVSRARTALTDMLTNEPSTVAAPVAEAASQRSRNTKKRRRLSLTRAIDKAIEVLPASNRRRAAAA